MRNLIRITPLGSIMLVLMIVVIITGLSTALVNLNFLDTRNILDRVDQTANDTRSILQNNNRTSLIVSEIKIVQDNLTEFERETEEGRQNQTDRLLPIFFRQFNQTDRIEDLMQEVVEQLAQQRFTEKEIRDNMVQLTFDVDRLVNVTERLINQSLD